MSIQYIAYVSNSTTIIMICIISVCNIHRWSATTSSRHISQFHLRTLFMTNHCSPASYNSSWADEFFHWTTTRVKTESIIINIITQCNWTPVSCTACRQTRHVLGCSSCYRHRFAGMKHAELMNNNSYTHCLHPTTHKLPLERQHYETLAPYL